MVGNHTRKAKTRIKLLGYETKPNGNKNQKVFHPINNLEKQKKERVGTIISM